MATITRIEFEVLPGPTVDTLRLRMPTTVEFSTFDRTTGLTYLLTFRLFAVGSQEDRPRPDPRVVRAVPGDVDVTGDVEIPVELQAFPPIRIRDVRSLDPVGDGDDVAVRVVRSHDGTDLLDVEFEIARTTADEDPVEHDPDELQIRAELVPELPTTTTAFSNVVRENL